MKKYFLSAAVILSSLSYLMINNTNLTFENQKCPSLTAEVVMEKDENQNSNEKPENPLERELWNIARKGGPIDPQLKLNALKQFNKKLEAQGRQSVTKDAGLNDWTDLGPSGVGGRARSFVIDPNNNNHIHLGSASGGIWETWNGGTTWTQVSDFLPSLSVSDMEYDPFSNTTIYAATGEGVGLGGVAGAGQGGGQPGMGIFRSTNNGNTWTQLNQPPGANFFWVNDIILDPDNEDWIYAVTTNSNQSTIAGGGRIYRSMDAGDTWSPLAFTTTRALDIKINPTDSDEILVGCQRHLYRSTNAQNANPTFTEITGGANQIGSIVTNGRIEISYCPSNVDRVYASVDDNGTDEIWRSEDGGATWSQRTGTGLGGGQSWFANAIWVSPINSNVLVIGGVDLYRSTNGGNTFTKITRWQDDINGNGGGGNNSIHADHHMIIEFNNFNGSTNEGVYIANDGGLYSTNDISTVSQNSGWISNVGNLRITQCYGGAISTNGQHMVVGTQDNSFAYSDDSGATWDQPITGDGAFAAIDPDDEDIMYANVNNNGLFKTTNGGSSWTRLTRFTTPTTCSPGACCGTGSYPAIGCISGGVFYVEDNASLISYFCMDPNDSDNILVGARRLWRNTNGGNANNWSQLKAASGTADISTVEVDVGSSARIWVGYETGRVERTTNTGASWSGNISPGNGFVTDIAINPNNSNQVIVSLGGYNTNNLFYTSNGNAVTPVWTNINTGVAVQINSVVWHPDNSNWIYVGTDLGILASEDRGSTWSVTPLYSSVSSEGPINSEVSQLFWRPNSTQLCAATHGRGLWRSNTIYDKIYVDKNQTCVFPNLCIGTFAFPFQTLAQANAAAGHGSEIIFLSSNTHNEISGSSILITKRIDVSLDNGNSPVIIE